MQILYWCFFKYYTSTTPASTASKHQLSKGKDVHKKDFIHMKVKEGPVYPVDAFSFRNEDAWLSHLNNATNSQIVKLNKLNNGINSDLDYVLVDSGANISVASYSLAKRFNCRNCKLC